MRPKVEVLGTYRHRHSKSSIEKRKGLPDSSPLGSKQQVGYMLPAHAQKH